MTETDRPRYTRKTIAVQAGGGFFELSYGLHEPPKIRRTVLCLHDIWGNSNDFGELAHLLVGHGYRVVCPDMPGRGESAYLPDRALYNPHTYMVSLLTLMQTLGKTKFAVIGKGWGGLLALGLAHLPEVSVTRMVITDLPIDWRAKLDPPLIEGARSGYASADAARTALAASEEFAGPFAELNRPIIEGRLRQGQAGTSLAFDPALLSPEGSLRQLRASSQKAYDGVKSRLLLLSASALGERRGAKLREIIEASPRRTYADALAPGGRVHFNTGHQLLLTFGFLESAYTPSK